MKAKKALVCKLAFPKPPKSLQPEPVVLPGIAYKRVTKVEVANALMFQSATKAPGPDKINFQILRMI